MAQQPPSKPSFPPPPPPRPPSEKPGRPEGQGSQAGPPGPPKPPNPPASASLPASTARPPAPAPPAPRASRTLPRSRVTIGSGAGAPDVDDIEKLEAIREVMEYAAHVTVQTALAKPMRSVRARPILLGITALLCLALTAFTFLAEPDWVFGPASRGVSAEERDAHVRYAMFLAAQRIHALRDSATGAAPVSLPSIGEDWSGLRYQPLDLGEFELRGRSASGDEIVFKSGESLADLVKGVRPWLRRQVEASP